MEVSDIDFGRYGRKLAGKKNLWGMGVRSGGAGEGWYADKK